jgi:hypothetical protein
MQNRGTLVACDRDAARVETLQQNLQRLGVTIARVVQHDWRTGTLPDASAQSSFDRILIDAPCTNTGVMRRRVDVRWRLRPADFERMQTEQLAIVAAVLPLLKVGGALVYSTCSIEPEEKRACRRAGARGVSISTAGGAALGIAVSRRLRWRVRGKACAAALTASSRGYWNCCHASPRRRSAVATVKRQRAVAFALSQRRCVLASSRERTRVCHLVGAGAFLFFSVED